MKEEPIRFTMLEPFGLQLQTPKALAAPLPSLEGKVIGALWNSKAEGDEVLGLVLKILKEKHGARDVKLYKKKHASGPAPPAQLDELARLADAFVTGVGD